jgi:Yip1 domain
VNLDILPGNQVGGSSTKVNDTPRIDLSRASPFLTIWTRPRATIRSIIEQDPTFRVLPIAMVGGIVQALQIESLLSAGSQFSILVILLIAVVVGPPLGLILLYAGAWLVELSCRLFGGKANSRDVRAALAWSLVPVLATIPLGLVRIAILGRDMFILSGFDPFAHPILVYGTGIPELVLSVWCLVVTVKTLGEVQRFTDLRAFNSMLLLLVPPVVLIVILAIVAYVIVQKLLT